MIEKELKDEMDHSIQEWIESHPTHSLGGCFAPGDKMMAIHNGVIRTIQNWCGNCIDPGNGLDMFYNKRSMWKALNMIYQLLEELQEDSQLYEFDWGGERHELIIPKIKSINNGGVGSK